MTVLIRNSKLLEIVNISVLMRVHRRAKPFASVEGREEKKKHK